MPKSDSATRRQGGAGWALVRACPACGGEEGRCRCPASAAPSRQGKPVARLRIEKRRGKPVTVAALEAVSPADLKLLAKELRRLLGTGGTVTGTELELQGAHLERLREILRDRDMQVKG